VELPLSRDAAANLAQGRRVVLADSDPGVHRAVGALLAREGLQFAPSRSLDELAAVLESGEVSALLIDPAMDGGAGGVLPEVLARYPGLRSRIILLAGRDVPSDPTLAGLPRLAKPLVPREARAAILAILDR